MRLANEFKDVIKGVKNLTTTYKDDSTACVGLDLIREMMEEYIELYGDKDEEIEPHPIVDDGVVGENEIELEEEEVFLDEE
jgi:hypothetical protein